MPVEIDMKASIMHTRKRGVIYKKRSLEALTHIRIWLVVAIGLWRDGRQHGYGILKYSNGDVYAGNYVEGKRQGRGIFRKFFETEGLDTEVGQMVVI